MTWNREYGFVISEEQARYMADLDPALTIVRTSGNGSFLTKTVYQDTGEYLEVMHRIEERTN